MGEAEERCSAGAGCSFSLTCLEDGADLDTGGSAAESADCGKLAASLYGDAEEDKEEYMDHLVSKESSFCCSTSSSSCSPVVSDAGAETCPCPSPMAASSDEWFRCARRATVEWVFEVTDGSVQHSTGIRL
jgi:cyclin D5, plant